jgi:hypothetical protein
MRSVPDVVGTGLDEPTLVGENHDLGPVPETKFGEDVGDVRLDGGGADEQIFGDLGIALAPSHCHDDLTLPVGETAEAV